MPLLIHLHGYHSFPLLTYCILFFQQSFIIEPIIIGQIYNMFANTLVGNTQVGTWTVK